MRHAPYRLALLVALPFALGAAGDPDLRDLAVGTPAADLPAQGYAGFACEPLPVSPDGVKTIGGWADWSACPGSSDGTRGVRFRYSEGETRVAGQPVRLTARFDPAGKLASLRIETDPAAPMFLRKKAFLLGLQARSRYGNEGWACSEGTPGDGSEPIGGVFVDETCRKRLADREVAIERHLFRRPGAAPTAFVGESRITVTASR